MNTIYFKNKPSILKTYTVAGPKEGKGSLGKYYDIVIGEDTFGEKTFEKAERKIMFTAVNRLMEKVKDNPVDVLILGDLLNQNITASFTARELGLPLLGVYSACSSFTESLLLGSSMIDGGYLKGVISGTSSHFSSAERQYRYPLELGCTRPPLSQWTVTGAGCCYLGAHTADMPYISCATIGTVKDYGVTDANDMGAAMAPAAADTIFNHIKNTNSSPDDYDLIVTGDLGSFGSRILKDLLWEKGVDVDKQHVDCGEMVFNMEESEYQGGSGAGCSALVFCSYIYNLIKEKKYKKILLAATGALLSSLTTQQGESIPSISHAVEIGV